MYPTHPGPLQQRQNNSNTLTTHRHVRDDKTTPNLGTRGDWLDSMNQRVAHVPKYCQQHQESVSGQRRGVFYLYEPAQVAYLTVRFQRTDVRSGNE